MRSTLFYIPAVDPFFDIPIFGFGWLLLVWAVISVALVGWALKKYGWHENTWGQIPVLLVLGAAIGWIAPMLQEQTPDGILLGLPIRGYGVMVMLGVICGVGLVVYRGRQMGVDPDLIFSLAFAVFIAGIVGSRVFYVVEYWRDFKGVTFRDTVFKVVNFTQGGLVVYGCLIGAAIAGFYFLRKRRLPVLAICDIVAPGLVLGLALGRVGCLLHGCCWGGNCDENPIGITFPVGSPPYVDQLEKGQLVGMRLQRSSESRSFTVVDVLPGGLAEQQGLVVGDEIIGVELPTAQEYWVYRFGETKSDIRVFYTTRDRRRISWSLGELPARSLPVYPTQILSAINATLICVFLWFFYPFRQRDGVVFATLLTIYPITRFLLEMIRIDEASVLQTDFKITISQAISCVLLALVVALWYFILSQPKRLALPIRT